MPELILSGGTGKNKEKKLFKLFLERAKNNPILYIPIAKEKRPHEESYEWFVSNVRKKDVTMLTDLSKKINLSKFKGIFIGGGNTFKLLKEIKSSKFDKKLKSFKGIIYGGSAGAIIFGKDISLVLFGKIKDKNKVKLKNLKGLNLINYNIKCHYVKSEKNLVKDYVKKTKTPIIALPEDSGIYIKNKKIHPINKIYLFKEVK